MLFNILSYYWHTDTVWARTVMANALLVGCTRAFKSDAIRRCHA